MGIANLIVVCLVLWGGIQGFRKGFFHEAASLAGLIAGIYLGIIFSDVASRIAAGMVNWNPAPVKTMVFLVVFVLVLLGLRLLSSLLTRVFKSLMINMLNRIAGFFFGVIKYTLILSVLLMLLIALNNKIAVLPDNFQSQSTILNWLDQLAPAILSGFSLN